MSSGHENAPGRIRTCDPQLRRLLLYPTELRARMLRNNPSNPLTGYPQYGLPFPADSSVGLDFPAMT
jgi:hypothetical protein